jgi:hypothetical protein
MSSVNKVILVDEYKAGKSLTELSVKHGVSVSTIRYHVAKAGALRSRAEGVRSAAMAGRLGSGMRGKARAFTDAHKSAISKARLKWADKNAVGFCVKPNGYVEYTRGEHKGRSEHVVTMEKRLGRKLLSDEHVHHIDGDKQNNNENNLALVTKSGHARLHRLQDNLSGKARERNENGRFS